ncbi:DUF2862 domain-containing protein [Prochlorococcus sp. MIT 1307]|uniref:DUF2862 domain-containing protein n=1 Tax=Prochlorococcus sp. MIT 1307 TaxID=3096219 RepID=UPI002A75CD3A|nr:DUF2862 domain-containing protein [Prochlorococcus sp. MIT 1307]
MVKPETLVKGQILMINLNKVRDRLPSHLIEKITLNPFGKLIGYKMVDGNNFGLVLDLGEGNTSWFFEDELAESHET